MKNKWRALQFAVKTIRSHKSRTFLSVLGVVIGVFSVVVVMSLGNGVQNFVRGQVETFGTDVIQVEIKVPNTGKMSSQNSSSIAQGVQITTLKIKDGEAIENLPNVSAVYAGSIGQERATHGSIGKSILLFGTGANVPLVDANATLESGRFYT
ncbi:MAG: ABC transporter permease, partial [Patescibacteria group bacterium]